MCAGGFGGTERELIEVMMALQNVSQLVDERGFPSE